MSVRKLPGEHRVHSCPSWLLLCRGIRLACEGICVLLASKLGVKSAYTSALMLADQLPEISHRIDACNPVHSDWQ